MSNEFFFAPDARGYAVEKYARKDEGDTALTASLADILLIDARGLTGFKEFQILNTDGSITINYEILGSQDWVLSETDFRNATNTSKTVETITASTSLAAAAAPAHFAKVTIVSPYRWLKLRLSGNTASYIATFMGI